MEKTEQIAGLEPDLKVGPSGVVAAGYVFAILFPLVGVVLGIVAATRDQRPTSKHGVWIVLLSVAAFFAWAVLLLMSVTITGEAVAS